MQVNVRLSESSCGAERSRSLIGCKNGHVKLRDEDHRQVERKVTWS